MDAIPPVESTIVEFKSDWSDSIKKELIAFANTFGGDLYVGVSDNGSPIGLNNPTKLQERIVSLARDNIFPSILHLLAFKVLTIEGRSILLVHVDRGDDPPYRLGPNDVNTIYVRVGNTSMPASYEQICRFVNESNPIPWESRLSKNQNLTFDYFDTYSSARKFPVDVKKHLNLGLWDKFLDGFTNLALLLSDQNPFEVRLSVYDDDDRSNLTNTAIFSGSLLKVLEETDQATLKESHCGIRKQPYGGLERIELYDVPRIAIREAVVNMMVHRDFMRTPPCTVQVTPSQISFFSIGGPCDLSVEELVLMTATNCRNPKLAMIFNRLSLMEGVGSGFNKIQACYSHVKFSDLLTIGETMFVIHLPRDQSKNRRLNFKPIEDPLTNRIQDFVGVNGQVSRRQIESELSMPRSTVSYKLLAMMKAGLIRPIGKGKNTVYVLGDLKIRQ